MTRTPRIEANGVPFCSRDRCPQYDGKRCEEMGFRPDAICEPEVAAMVTELRTLRAAPAPAAQWTSRPARCQLTTHAQPSREPNDAGGGP